MPSAASTASVRTHSLSWIAGPLPPPLDQPPRLPGRPPRETEKVIEHNMDVIRNADWIVDLGPEGGSKGGRVGFEGKPRQIPYAPGCVTGQYPAPPLPAAQ